MWRIKYCLIVSLFIVSSVIAGVVSAGSASAASTADLIVKPTDSLAIVNYDESCVIDLSTTWAGDFRNFLSGEQLASFDNREAWAVSVWYDSLENFKPNHVVVYWWDSTNLPATATFTHDALNQSNAQVGYMYIPYDQCGLAAYFPSQQWPMPLAQYMGGSTYNLRPFLAYGVDINYPDGYEGELVPSSYVGTPKYVAMGDSFSSGEGNPSFENGTDEDNVNKCHRSSQAYPRLLQHDQDLNLGPTAFVACSGATTWNVLNGQENEPAQVKALSTDTKVVTITIGGNDVGFKDFATACTVGICNFSTTAYSTIVSKINNELPASLKKVLDTIANKVSSSTKVYIVGYPHIAPSKMPTGASSACWPLNGQFDDRSPKKNDGAAVRDVVTKLNTTIFNTVKGTNDGRFVYVSPNETGSPFTGHDWCTGNNSYFGIVQLPNYEHSFHPNGAGHAAYKEVVKAAIN
jgi:hypothetical protein